MKILALADIHGAYDRAEAILKREWPWDGLIIAGDLTTHGSEQEADAAIVRFLSFGGRVVGVCGNMDLPRLERVFTARGISINQRCVSWESIGLFGVSGSPPTPMHTPYELDEIDIAERAMEGWKDASTHRTTIFVPHAPPARTAVDRIASGHHVGSSAVRTFIEKRKPTLVVCGHIHESRGIDSLGPTTIVNCGPALAGKYAVIEAREKLVAQLKDDQT